MVTVKERYVPLLLTLVVIITDQFLKGMVVANLQIAQPVPVIGDVVRLTYVQNSAIAFSIGRSIPEEVRRVLLLILPLAVISIISIYYLTTNDMSLLRRYLIAAIIGGGIGNYIDRIMRPDGVVDFVDVKFYGILGFDRWPTFNLADSVVVVAGILLIASSLLRPYREQDPFLADSNEESS